MTQKLGKGMIIAAWVGVAALLTFAFQRYLDHARNPNQKLQVVGTAAIPEIVLERNRYGHYVATGSINDVSADFLLDTGATHVAVPQALARKLRLTPGPMVSVTTANGVIRIHTARLDKVALGPIVLHNVRATIHPHMQNDEVLLGMAFLRELEFTQRGDRLMLRQLPGT